MGERVMMLNVDCAARRRSVFRQIVMVCGLTSAGVAFAVAPVTAPEPLSLVFDKIPVLQFVEATYGGMLKLNYVVSPAALAVDKVVSMRVERVEVSAVAGVLSRVLEYSGLTVKESGGVVYVDIKPDLAPDAAVPAKLAPEDELRPEDVIELYRPRFRSVDYLRSILAVVDRSMSNRGAALVGFAGGPAMQMQLQPLTSRAAGPVQPMTAQQGYQSAVMQPGFSAPHLATGQSFGAFGSSPAATQDVLVLVGNEEKLTKVRAVLDKADVPSLSVLVKAALVEVSATREEGYNVGAVLSLLGGRLGVALSGGSKGTNHITWKGSTVDAFVSAVAGDNHYKIVTEPRLMVADGQTGRLSVGSDVPTRGAVTLDNQGNAIQAIEYRQSGVIMSVTPRVFRDRVGLRVSQQISNFAMTATSNIDSPTLVKRDIETAVDLQDGELLVLGGLDEQKDTKATEGLPFLPSFLRSTSSNDARTQLVMVMEVQRVEPAARSSAEN